MCSKSVVAELHACYLVYVDSRARGQGDCFLNHSHGLLQNQTVTPSLCIGDSGVLRGVCVCVCVVCVCVWCVCCVCVSCVVCEMVCMLCVCVCLTNLAGDRAASW